MSFNNPGEPFLKTTSRNYKKAAKRVLAVLKKVVRPNIVVIALYTKFPYLFTHVSKIAACTSHFPSNNVKKRWVAKHFHTVPHLIWSTLTSNVRFNDPALKNLSKRRDLGREKYVHTCYTCSKLHFARVTRYCVWFKNYPAFGWTSCTLS